MLRKGLVRWHMETDRITKVSGVGASSMGKDCMWIITVEGSKAVGWMEP
jgi:hypothetical protein